MIADKKSSTLTFFCIRALFFGTGISYAILSLKQDAWIAILIAFAVGFLMLILKEKINNFTHFKIIRLLFASFLLLYAILSMQTFIANFFLDKTPAWVIILPLIWLVYVVCKKGLKTITRVAQCFLPISTLLLVTTYITLGPMIKFDNFLPVFDNNWLEIIKCGLMLGIIGIAPIFLIAKKHQESKKVFVFSFGTIFLIVICIIGVLGHRIASIYQYSEYIVLKKIVIFDFLEKMENILSITWILDLFILMSLSSYVVKDILETRSKNLAFKIYLVIMALLAIILCKWVSPFDFGMGFSYILLGFILLILLLGAIELVIGDAKITRRVKLDEY